jgi:hypothetical protein
VDEEEEQEFEEALEAEESGTLDEAVTDDINDAGPSEDPLEPAVESAEPTGEAEDS